MSSCCSGSCHSHPSLPNKRYRKVLWVALLINVLMFGVEPISSVRSGSASLLADSVDFLGDAGNYAVSLFVLGMATIWRSRAAYAKGIVMGVFSVLVLTRAMDRVGRPRTPGRDDGRPKPSAFHTRVGRRAVAVYPLQPPRPPLRSPMSIW